MELLKAYLKERRLTLAAFLLFVGVFAVSFALYGLPLAAVGYPAGLCVLLGACLAAWDYGRAARRHKALKRLREAGEAVLLDLPAMTTVEGTDCAAVVETLRRELRRQETARAARWEDMTAYYTAWVHQIKTPIAAMRLTLQGEDTPAARRLMTELGRVEQVFGGGENHPYTRGLLRCAPDLGELKPRLEPIPGHMPEPTRLPPGCAFAERCPECTELCRRCAPAPRERDGHLIACHHRWKEG